MPPCEPAILAPALTASSRPFNCSGSDRLRHGPDRHDEAEAAHSRGVEIYVERIGDFDLEPLLPQEGGEDFGAFGSGWCPSQPPQTIRAFLLMRGRLGEGSEFDPDGNLENATARI